MSEQIKDFTHGSIRFSVHLDPQFDIERHVIEKGIWEPLLVACAESLIKPGYDCVDIGANFGFHSLCMASLCGPTGKVYAFEPNPLTFERLIRNLDLNLELKTRVAVSSFAAGSERSSSNVFQSGAGNAYVAKTVRPEYYTTDNERAVAIQVLPLDEALPTQKIDLMKIDVEGMESEVLQGAERIIRQWQPILILETLMECFDPLRIKAVEEWLHTRGYIYFGVSGESMKLTAVTYPNLAEDSYAIPRSKILSFARILKQANEYAFNYDMPSIESLPVRPVIADFLLVAIGQEFTGASFSVDGISHEAPGQLNTDSVRLETEYNGRIVKLDIFPIGKDLSNWKGQLDYAGKQFPFSLHKTGGSLSSNHLWNETVRLL